MVGVARTLGLRPHNIKPCAAWFGEKRPAAAGGRRRQAAFCAAVEKHEELRKPEVFFGYRKPARSDEAASSEALVNTLIFAVSRKAKMQTSLAAPTAVRSLILIDQSLFFSSHIVSDLV